MLPFASMAKVHELQNLIGRQVGRYSVVRHLASGGMAELYIAKQEAMGGFEKPVVLKVLQPRYAENPRVVTMFLDEARLAAKLNHPSIVHVYDVAEEDPSRGGMKYIAMEYIHGETVADIVKRGLGADNYLPLEHAIHVVRQTAAGLGYAHDRREEDGHVLRIVHRDVSPTNILVSYEGQTKIVDFGIARAQDELREESGIRPGKASYMSPEQVRGQGADYRSDIFSLGIILYELTLCQRLYRGTPEVVMRRIVDEKVPPPTAIRRDYPPPLELIVMRALEKRPEDRYQSAAAMHHDLEEFLDESGMRSGNRRMALYMNELFAPEGPADEADAARGASDEASDNEELDFDRRAPLAMRIEVAHETPPPAIAKPAAAPAVRQDRDGQVTVPRSERGERSGGHAIPGPRDTPTVARRSVRADAGPLASGDGNPGTVRPSLSWVLIALFVAAGIAAMVFVTLK
jgi:eukaryotic-like serine/threonine-protein kinase